MPPGKIPRRNSASWKKCILERMPPEYSETRKKCLLRKNFISTCKHVILQIYTVTSTTYNVTKYYYTAGSDYNFKGILIFSLESYTVANACQKFTNSFLPILLICAKVL